MDLILGMQQAVQRSLDHYLYDNAIFLAERLYSEAPNFENLHIVANSYFLSGDIGSAYRMLKQNYPYESHDAVYHKVMYLLGVCQSRLHRYSEAERTFQELLNSGCEGSLPTNLVAASQYWLGLCFKANGKKSSALEALRGSVFKDPSLFVAYETCVAHFQPAETQNPYEETNPVIVTSSSPSTTSSAGTQVRQGPKDSSVASKARTSVLPLPGQAKRLPKSPMTTMTSAGTNRRSSLPSPAPRQYTDPARELPLPPNHSAKSILQSPVAGHGAFEMLNTHMKSLLRACAHAVRLLWSYKCSDAVAFLTSQDFPPRQKGSGWYITILARAHYENGNNAEAAGQWAHLRRKEPWRVTHTLAYYSTALWHLRREKELSLLAQQLIEIEPRCATTLCVTGNFYSILKDHQQALTMFQRATQVEKSFAYAHTLKGYEHNALEESAEAEQCFRTALRLEPRNYLAIGGLGEVNAKQGHQITARQHFQQALDINPYPALYSRLAMTLSEDMTLEAWTDALQLFDQAIARDPSNLSTRHHRAEVYIKLGQHQQAMVDLEYLRMKCPKEAAVFITLARCHRKIGNKQQAMFFFHHAVDLDDQWSAMAKAAIDRMTQDNGNHISDSD